MGEKLQRFTEEEDQILMENWWDQDRREETAERLHRPFGSCNFRYYKLLRESGINPSIHKATQVAKTLGEYQQSPEKVTAGNSGDKSAARIKALENQVQELRKHTQELQGRVQTLTQNNKIMQMALEGLQLKIERLEERDNAPSK